MPGIVNAGASRIQLTNNTREEPMVSSSFARRAFFACTALTLAGLAPAAAGEFDGVTINIMTFTGPQIAEPIPLDRDL